MKRIILAIIAAIIATSFSVSAESLIHAADSAYMADKYEASLNLYRKALATEGSSAELYYNIGNCYYRLGQPGRAIVNYERALRLDPAMSDARANLDFVRSRITDRPGTTGTFLGDMADSAVATANSNTWAWLALTAFIITLGAVALYIFSDTIILRKSGFFGAMAMLVVTIILAAMAWRGASLARATDVAIVTAPSTILSTAPRAPHDRNEEAMLLHEGTRVVILDSVSIPVSAADSASATWLDVKIDNEHRAWINAADIEKVL